MPLTKVKIRDFVIPQNEKNKDGLALPFKGLNRDKEFMPTIATTDGLDCKKYKMLRKGYFVYSGMQTGRDNCIRLGYYTDENPSLISPAYITFTINKNIVIPEYFFMFFKSTEKDRYGSFLSDGSIRANLDWDVFCDITLEIPTLDVQKKYVAVYDAMIGNQKKYEKRLDDLWISAQASIENLKGKKTSLKNYIERIQTKNINDIKNVIGISNNGFIKPKNKSDVLTNYNVITNGCFVYNPSAINLGSIELYSKNEVAVCSPIYVVFKVKDESKLDKEYLNIWLHRQEFFRMTEYYSLGSVRNNFTYELMEEIQISMPPIEVQTAIAKIYKSYRNSKEINEKLKSELAQICSVLIKGSIEEAKQKNIALS